MATLLPYLSGVPRMNDAAAALLNLLDHLKDRIPLDDRARAMLAEALDAYFTGGSETLDAALGIRPGPGESTLAATFQRHRRDTILREVADRFMPGAPPAAQAREISKRWGRYAASGWVRERLQDEMPQHRIGKPEAAFWRIMKAHDQVLSERSIRSILAAKSEFSLPANAATLLEHSPEVAHGSHRKR